MLQRTQALGLRCSGSERRGGIVRSRHTAGRPTAHAPCQRLLDEQGGVLEPGCERKNESLSLFMTRFFGPLFELLGDRINHLTLTLRLRFCSVVKLAARASPGWVGRSFCGSVVFFILGFGV